MADALKRPSRNPRGRPTVAEQVKIDERRTKALRMAAQAISWEEIATACGYSNALAAHKDVLMQLAKRRKENGPDVDGYRELELNKLDIAERIVWGIVRGKHVLAQQGRVVITPDGEIATDPGPVLAAIDRLVKISDRRARLLSLDAPLKVEMRSTDELDNEIAGLMAQLARVRKEVPADAAQDAVDGSDGQRVEVDVLA